MIGGEGSWRDVKIYNPVHDTWKQGTSIDACRAGHCSVVLQERIYVIAGHDGEFCQNSVECYSPFTNQWSKASNISKVRRFASAATICEKIIIVGGFADMTLTNIEHSCEMFEPSTNQWSLVSSPESPRAAGAIVSIDDIVYLFGGENENDFDLESVERFDLAKNKWHAIGSLPENCRGSYLPSSLLRLPKEFITK